MFNAWRKSASARIKWIIALIGICYYMCRCRLLLCHISELQHYTHLILRTFSTWIWMNSCLHPMYKMKWKLLLRTKPVVNTTTHWYTYEICFCVIISWMKTNTAAVASDKCVSSPPNPAFWWRYPVEAITWFGNPPLR